MADRRKPQDARLGDFLRDLSSPDRHTGSGAAGAIALALAAACAAKAVAITLKHEPANTRLLQARDQLLTHIDAAVRSSNEDTDCFAEFLRHRSKQTAQSVISADSKLLVLIDDVATILEALDPQVRQNVSGDLVAARALSSAARAIQIENIAEMREAKTD